MTAESSAKKCYLEYVLKKGPKINPLFILACAYTQERHRRKIIAEELIFRSDSQTSAQNNFFFSTLDSKDQHFFDGKALKFGGQKAKTWLSFHVRLCIE